MCHVCTREKFVFVLQSSTHCSVNRKDCHCGHREHESLLQVAKPLSCFSIQTVNQQWHRVMCTCKAFIFTSFKSCEFCEFAFLTSQMGF